ncbi:MAG: p-hydroxycinnamoyl CoA hydratase/lyase [Rhodospirillaceae bacterium]|nr:p-hydroxycinnamoyl CoA hydratase/lyase [Rhodospirillaceae bacterium]|tara:strand:+ start:2821 stop:3705 length:885 start_codon:yes stop_codon:yes gene_type:complete
MARKPAAKKASKKASTRKAAPKYKYENVLVDQRKDGITIVTLNRPEKRNAMSPQLHHDMDDALEKLAVDSDTKVLIITGAGKAFCAGQDLKTYFRGLSNDPVARARAAAASESWRSYRLIGFPKPTIAMVNGFVFGGGLTPIVSCDVAVASHTATFGISEINWGHIPGGLVGWNVNQVMSFRDAMWYSISGDTFNGKEAAAMKFVNFSVPHNKLKSETLKIARKLMKKNPWAIQYTKEAIRSVRDMNMEQAADYLRCKSDALQRVDKEQGRQEGMRQFLDSKSFRPGVGTYKRK